MTSKIEWLRDPISGKQGYTLNPVRGLCPVACSFCYAAKMYKRFKWDETIRFDPDVMSSGNLSKLTNGSKVFVGSTMELFGEWAEEWIDDILDCTVAFPNLTFIFLTKRPENLIKYSPFPPNCWVGVSATNKLMFTQAVYNLVDVRATVKFVSIEPLLDWKLGGDILSHDMDNINWLIIGQCTPVSVKTSPKVEWISEIVEAADKAGIPIFLKDNLESVFVEERRETTVLFKTDTVENINLFYPIVSDKPDRRHLRQEYPKVSNL
jgi:protein gp37